MSERVDCDDTEASISPGATETWYNGVDEDCGEDCDYDQDGDGFADARQGAANDCGLPATDCLDIADDIFPGAPGEIYYDGEDQDCDKVNDFDPDGDGDAWAGYEARNSTFLTRYGYAATITSFTECYDADDGPLPQTGAYDPATVNSTATEIFYDGVDGDCGDLVGGVENDFDADADGYMRTADRGPFLTYVQRYVEYTKHDGTKPYKAIFESTYGANTAAWQAYFDARDNDCNDARADVHPGALEKLGDSVDQDCDGGNDTTPFVFGTLALAGLGSPELASTTDRFVLLVNATEGANFGSGPEGPQVVAVSFALDATSTSSPNKDNTPYGVPTSDTLSPGLGLAAYADGYYASFGWERSGNTRLRATLSTAGSSSSSAFSVDDEADSSRVSAPLSYDETDLACDAETGTCWGIACDGSGFQFMEFNAGTTPSTFEPVQSGQATTAADDCFVITDAAYGTLLLATANGAGTVSTWAPSGTGSVSSSADNPFSAVSIDHVQTHGDLLVAGLKSTGVLLWLGPSAQTTALSTRPTQHADADTGTGSVYVAAVERGGARIWLAYGDPTGTLTEVALPFAREGATLTPEYVAIEVRGDRVAVAAVSSTDELGWLFFEI
jgi:hypothetical protein